MKTGAVFVENTRAVFKEPAAEAGTRTSTANHQLEAGALVEKVYGSGFRPGACSFGAAVCRRLPALRGDSRLRAQLAEVTAPQPLPPSRCTLPHEGRSRRFWCLPVRTFSTSISMWRWRALRGIVVPFWMGRVPSSLRTFAAARAEAGGTMNLLIGRSSLPSGDYTLVVSAEGLRTRGKLADTRSRWNTNRRFSWRRPSFITRLPAEYPGHITLPFQRTDRSPGGQRAAVDRGLFRFAGGGLPM